MPINPVLIAAAAFSGRRGIKKNKKTMKCVCAKAGPAAPSGIRTVKMLRAYLHNDYDDGGRVVDDDDDDLGCIYGRC